MPSQPICFGFLEPKTLPTLDTASETEQLLNINPSLDAHERIWILQDNGSRVNLGLGLLLLSPVGPTDYILVLMLNAVAVDFFFLYTFL